ncbi:SMP-30/gluconolactonase/LRE family protein [Sphingomonas koreensis]
MRRAGLALASAMLLAGCATTPRSGGGDYVARDHVADGVFTAGIEGPATGPDGALYVVNFGREGTIGRVVAGRDGLGTAQLFATLPAGSIGNGIRFAADGRMLVADYKGHRILAVSKAGEVSIHVALPGAHQPNDIALAPDGTIYASDPDWKNGGGRIWRIDRQGRAAILEDGMGTTNGIEVSPDGRRLYVGESVQRRIWVYDIGADGTLSGKRLFAGFADHGLDGMRCDRDGNLYVTRHGGGTVVILAPDGTIRREIRLKGRLPSNVAFGGRDGRIVYVTMQDRGAIEAFRSAVPGREH